MRNYTSKYEKILDIIKHIMTHNFYKGTYYSKGSTILQALQKISVFYEIFIYLLSNLYEINSLDK